MGYKIELHNPAYPRGEELGIPGLGLVKNGGSLTVSDAVMRSYLDSRNSGLAEDELKLTARTAFSGDMWKVSQAADPPEPNEEATQPPTHENVPKEGGE